MLKPYLRILIVAALCVAGLISLVVRESMARDSGTEVLLAMEAVDRSSAAATMAKRSASVIPHHGARSTASHAR